MKKAIIGTLLAAVVLFVWGAVSWMLIPWHDGTMKQVPQEQLVTDTLKTVIKEKGLYTFPWCGKDANGKVDRAAVMEKVKAGPVGMLIFNPGGGNPMSSSMFINGFLIDVGIAALLMWILWASRLKRAVHRIHLTAAVGLIAGLAVHLTNAVWMGYPAGYTAVGILDLLIGFILMGAALSPFVPETL